VFVFAALLEYAAVNYTYWSYKAKKRKQNNRQVLGTNVELDSEYGQNKARPAGEDIELEIIEDASHMSPLPWLANSETFNFRGNQRSVHSLNSFGSGSNLSIRNGSVAGLSFRNNIEGRQLEAEETGAAEGLYEAGKG